MPGLGAVISHILPNREERLIAFTSRSLSQSENYSQIDQEALALIHLWSMQVPQLPVWPKVYTGDEPQATYQHS